MKNDFRIIKIKHEMGIDYPNFYFRKTFRLFNINWPSRSWGNRKDDRNHIFKEGKK